MRTSSATARPAPKRSTAVNCLLVNQFATPGLGSLMARRFLEGAVQLTMAVVGFGFYIGWFVQLMITTYRQSVDLPPQSSPYPWMGKAGLIVFAASWLLAWVTSLSVLRQSRRTEIGTQPDQSPPPRMKPPKLN
jgi:hypothetical protein